MADKGFGYDFVINVVTNGVAQAKSTISQLQQSMNAWAMRGRLGQAIGGGITPADITKQIAQLKSVNPDEITKRRQREIQKEIANLEMLRRKMVNYQEAEAHGHGKLYLLIHRNTLAMQQHGSAAVRGFQSAQSALSPLMGFMIKFAGLLGIAIGLWQVFAFAINVVKSAIRGVINLFKESLSLGKDLEKMSFQLRPFFGSREKALGGINFALEQKGYKFEDTIEAMKIISERGVDVVKNMELFKDRAASAGATLTEFANDFSSAVDGNLEGLKRYNIINLMQFKHLQGYPQKMRDAILGHLKALKGGVKGMAKEWENSWEGMMNTLSNKWVQFKKMIIGSPTDEGSLFGWLRQSLSKFTTWLEDNWTKVQAIAQGIGRLFRTMAQAALSAFDTIFGQFDKMQSKDITEWFMRQEAKLAIFLARIVSWIKEKLADKDMWARVKTTIENIAAPILAIGKAVGVVRDALQLLYNILPTGPNRNKKWDDPNYGITPRPEGGWSKGDSSKTDTVSDSGKPLPIRDEEGIKKQTSMVNGIQDMNILLQANMLKQYGMTDDLRRKLLSRMPGGDRQTLLNFM